MSELIAAIAPPPGPGGVGILRLSGPGAAQAAAQEQTVAQTPAEEQTAQTVSNTAADETISDKYIRDGAGLFTRSAESAIQDYNKKIYSKTGSRIAILTTDGTGGKTIEDYTNSAFDSMGLSEYDMLFSIDTSAEQWYVTTGAYVADYADSKLEAIFQDGFAAILDGDADDAADTMYEDLYSWCKTSLNGTANEDYVPVQDTGRVRRKSMIGTIITILVIFWIIKAIFGSGRRGGGSGGFWSGLFLGSLFSNHHHHGPGPGPGPRPGPRPGGRRRHLCREPCPHRQHRRHRPRLRPAQLPLRPADPLRQPERDRPERAGRRCAGLPGRGVDHGLQAGQQEREPLAAVPDQRRSILA